MLEKKLGAYHLASNVVILGTMNDSAEAGFKGFNSAVRNRIGILPIRFNADAWLKDFGVKLAPILASFLKAYPSHITEPESTNLEGYASARAWTALSKELALHEPDFIKQNAEKITQTQVSSKSAQAFHKHVVYLAAVNFTKVVKNRKMLDMSKLPQLANITYSYIINFINTVAEGAYLLELLDNNQHQSSFVSFIIADLYTKFTVSQESDIPLSDGNKFVIDMLLGAPILVSAYTNATQAQLDMAKKRPVENITSLMNTASNFIAKD